MADIEYPIDFIRSDGAVWTAHTPDEAVGCRIDGDRHRSHVRYYMSDGTVGYDRIAEAEWIARDALGRIVHAEDLPTAPRAAIGWWNRRLLAARAAADRGLPIPGTGRHKGTAYRRTAPYIGEKRDMAAFAAELAEEGLADRMIVRLRNVGPVPYEDGAWRRTQRCWKKQRRTKWQQGRR